MAIAPIQPKGTKPLSVSIPPLVIKQLNAGTYLPNTQVVAKDKNGKKFITTLTNVIDWLVSTGTKVSDVLNDLGVINTRNLQTQIPQFDASTDGSGSDIVIDDGSGNILNGKEYIPPTDPKKENTITFLGLELTGTDILLGGAIGYLILKK